MYRPEDMQPPQDMQPGSTNMWMEDGTVSPSWPTPSQDMQPGSYLMQTEGPTRGPQEAWLRASGHTDRGSGHTSSNNGCITNYNAMEMHLKPKDECQETCARICAEEGRPQAFGNCGADKMKANDLVNTNMWMEDGGTVSPSWPTPSQDMQPGSMNMPTPSD